MTLKKRGLGRGLEALLVDVAAKEEQLPQTLQTDDYQPALDEQPQTPLVVDNSTGAKAQAGEVDGRTAMVVELFKNIQREHLVLLEEAEALKKMIEEFESIIRADLS